MIDHNPLSPFQVMFYSLTPKNASMSQICLKGTSASYTVIVYIRPVFGATKAVFPPS
jgi:hypothetical protein